MEKNNKKDVSVLVWSNGKPYEEIDRVIDSWHGTADNVRISEIVENFRKVYRHHSKFGFMYDIQIVIRN